MEILEAARERPPGSSIELVDAQRSVLAHRTHPHRRHDYDQVLTQLRKDSP
ncbi:MAG: hypothetical protein M3460_27340 [Actinomycetota bacterium]|nr:hypothetical protein [Actinomycetota bacterium]